MSPSIAHYNELYEPFRDADLFAVAGLLVHFLEKHKISDSLADMVAAWKKSCDESGPGTILFELDAIVADPSMGLPLEAALQFVEDELEPTWGAEIPGEVFNNRYEADFLWFDSFPTSRMADALGRLRRLVGAVIARNAAGS